MGSLRGAPMGPWTSPTVGSTRGPLRGLQVAHGVDGLVEATVLVLRQGLVLRQTKSRTAPRHGGGASRRFFSYKAATASRNFATRHELRSLQPGRGLRHRLLDQLLHGVAARGERRVLAPQQVVLDAQRVDLREAFPREVLSISIAVNAKRSSPVRIGHARVPLSFQLLLVPVRGQQRLQLIDKLLIREDRRATGGGHRACFYGVER